MAPRRSAEVPRGPGGRAYHLGVGRGEVAPYVVLCGDPARAERAAERLGRVRLRRAHREFVTVTGSFGGVPVSIVGTGIGPDNTEIAVVELAGLRPGATFLRAGTCGSLQRAVRPGELVVSAAALRLENTSTQFVPEGYPAWAHHEVVAALLEGCRRAGARAHLGLTATAPGIYGAQGRRVPGFPPRDPQLPRRLARLGVLNFEMEASVLFTLASLRGLRAGAVCAVLADRRGNRFAAPAAARRAEERCVAAALEAVRILAEHG